MILTSEKHTNIEVLSDSHIKDPSLKFNLIFHSEESIYIYALTAAMYFTMTLNGRKYKKLYCNMSFT